VTIRVRSDNGPALKSGDWRGCDSRTARTFKPAGAGCREAATAGLPCQLAERHVGTHGLVPPRNQPVEVTMESRKSDTS
jgi:hypothetical protein